MQKKICHLCLVGPYNEGWNYQENILPKYHVHMGLKVYQIVTRYMWEGNDQVLSNDKRYTNDFGVEIMRCSEKPFFIGGHRFDRHPDAKRFLEEINPDILFIHDVQTLDMKMVAKYLKSHPQCTVYADNHSDFSNSATNWLSKNILHKMIWRHTAHIINPYVKVFYGVLPARVDFLTVVYKLPKEKCKLLVMGADDEYVEKASDVEVRESIREKYNISKEDFLIVTGGKIDLFKTQTLLLMEAVKINRNKNIKLIVFGSIADELKDKVSELTDDDRVRYIGWVEAKETYPIFAASDLAVFPGRHSVFWEQAAGQGIPLVVKYWEGTTHVDRGGNVIFLHEDSVEEISRVIAELNKPDRYALMKESAKNAAEYFKYSGIARRSIEG